MFGASATYFNKNEKTSYVHSVKMIDYILISCMSAFVLTPYFVVKLLVKDEHRYKSLAYITDIVMLSITTFFNFYVYTFVYNPTLTFTKHDTQSVRDTMTFQVHMELAFYLAYTFMDFNMIGHHLITLLALYFAHMYQYNHLISLTLYLFGWSTPFLTLSKFARHQGFEHLSKFLFGVFAAFFFTFRVLAIPVSLLFVTIIDGWYVTMHTGEYIAYFLINTSLAFLYVMQLVWFKKIFQILRSFMFFYS